MALERWEVKVLCMFGLFASMSVFVLLPIKVSKAVAKQGQRGLLIISVLSCFGGGVFFGAYLTHMSPEVRAVLEEALLDPNGITYPLPELFSGLGFFLILFIEKFVMKCREVSEKKPKGTKTVAGRTPDMNGTVVITGAQYVNNGYTNGLPQLTSDGEKGEHIHHQAHHHATHGGLTPRPGYEDLVVPGTCCTPKHKEPDVISITSMTSKMIVMNTDDNAQTRSVIFMVAMSLDCIFEGMALGLMYETQDVIDLFIAIISHEFIMSFCIGLELVKYHNTKIVVLGGLTYAFTPVFGAIIGTCIVEIGGSGTDATTIDIATGVLQAMCAGTFIYCAFLGILKENLDDDHGILKSVVVLLGFGLMAGMAAIGLNSGDSPAEITTEMMETQSYSYI